MKKRSKYLVLTMVIVMSIQAISFTIAEGSETFSYEAEAQTLNDLGLYSGISNTTFDPDLGASLNRETGVVMLLRIFGLEAEALALTDAEADATLAQFTDASSIASWARTYVAYAVANGLVNGLPDGTFAPEANLVGKAYCTLILRQLGYTPNYDSAAAELADVGGLTATQAIVFSGKALIKDDLVGISFGSLSAADNAGRTVIEQLLADRIVDERAAADAGLIQPTPPPTPTPTPTPIPAPINNDRDDDDDDDDDNDNDNNIVGTGVEGSLTIYDGSDGVKEVNKLTIVNGAEMSGCLIFSMSDGQDPNILREIGIVAGDEVTVANAVYSALDCSILNYDVALENGGVDIYFTAKTEAEDRTVSIMLAEADSQMPTGVISTTSQVTAGMAQLNERAELWITNGATKTGTVMLTINNNSIYVLVQAGDAPEVIAEKLLEGVNSDPDLSNLQGIYEISQDGGLIIFVSKLTGDTEDLKITLE